MSGFWGTIQCNSCNIHTSTKSVTHRGDNIIECSNGRLLRICKDGRYACAACDPTINEYLQPHTVAWYDAHLAKERSQRRLAENKADDLARVLALLWFDPMARAWCISQDVAELNQITHLLPNIS